MQSKKYWTYYTGWE